MILRCQAPGSNERLTCHRFMGEDTRELELRALFEDPKDAPDFIRSRDSHVCPSCGWLNVFKSANGNSHLTKAVAHT